MRRTMAKCLFLLPLFLLVTACKEDSIFDHATLKYNTIEEEIQFTVYMDERFDFPIGATIPIKQYGELTLVPNFNGNLAHVILSSNPEMWGLEADLVYELPDGTPLSYFVNGPLLQIQIEENYYVYLSPEDFVHVGFCVLIPEIDEDFAYGLMVATNFKNEAGELIGGAILFGPKMQGGVATQYGGIFAIANIEVVLQEMEKTATAAGASLADFSKPYSMNYRQYKILKKAGYLK